MKRSILVTTLSLAGLAAACSNSSSQPQGTGGAMPGTGGGTAAQGGRSSGGTTSAGGAAGSSMGGAGGTNAGGGNPQGGSGTGGSAQSGGVVAGGSAAGGKATGGSTGAGGATGAGGGTSIPGAMYVAPDGDDANPGTLEKPLKTVAKARDLVRTKNSAMTSDITVFLRGGTYQQTDTLTFSNADSGSGGFYVKYMAYPGEQPLITGGKPITGWKLTDTTNGIYSASAGTTAFRQLYVNGVKAIRARTPNLGANGTANFNRLSGWDKNAHNVQVPSSAVGDWKNLTKVEMHINIAWGDSMLRIASISNSGGTAAIKFQSAEDAIVFIRPNPRMDQAGWGQGRAYFFENALEFLDQPGEWYLDETTNTVYYKPRTGEDMTKASVIVPMVETLMAVKGTSTSSQASYLWFQGLTFAHATYMRPSQFGFLDAQAFQYNLTAQANNDQTIGRPPAGVSVSNANHLRFERNLFTQMGATGLDFISGTHDDMIIGNAVTDIAGNGISVGKFVADENTEYHIAYNPTDKNEICSHETIKNNYVNKVTTEFFGGIGIVAGYPAFIDIEHNEISHTAYTGISVGYGWTSAVNAMTNNKINYNNLHHVNEIMTDGGAIYTLSNQNPASEMQYNYIHDYACSQYADYGCQGLYLDEQTAGYTVAHNVMQNCPTSIARNQNGQDTVTDNGANPQGAQNTIATAGIESAYADIKNLTVPAATF